MVVVVLSILMGAATVISVFACSFSFAHWCFVACFLAYVTEICCFVGVKQVLCGLSPLFFYIFYVEWTGIVCWFKVFPAISAGYRFVAVFAPYMFHFLYFTVFHFGYNCIVYVQVAAAVSWLVVLSACIKVTPVLLLQWHDAVWNSYVSPSCLLVWTVLSVWGYMRVVSPSCSLALVVGFVDLAILWLPSPTLIPVFVSPSSTMLLDLVSSISTTKVPVLFQAQTWWHGRLTRGLRPWVGLYHILWCQRWMG